MKQIKAVLFDLDGTLINSIYDLADAVNYALGKNGYPSHEVDEFYYFVGDGVIKMIERALPENVRSEALALQLRADFLEYYSVHSRDKTRSYEGVPQLVAALRQKGLKLAVVTNKVDAEAKVLVEQYYPQCFDLIYGQRDGIPTKPDPTLAHIAMKDLGVTPEECLFVGDSGVDIQTAVNSGALPVGVLWGFRKEDELCQCGAKQIIAQPKQLLQLLGEESE